MYLLSGCHLLQDGQGRAASGPSPTPQQSTAQRAAQPVNVYNPQPAVAPLMQGKAYVPCLLWQTFLTNLRRTIQEPRINGCLQIQSKIDALSLQGRDIYLLRTEKVAVIEWAEFFAGGGSASVQQPPLMSQGALPATAPLRSPSQPLPVLPSPPSTGYLFSVFFPHA